MIEAIEVLQFVSYGRDDVLYADEQDIQEYSGQSTIGFDPEYLLRELLFLLMTEEE